MKNIAHLTADETPATTPLPGRPVRGSRSGRPLMALLDLLGRRTAPRIVWELREGELTFRGLQDAAETNPCVLNARLTDLRAAGIVDHAAGRGYALSSQGRELLTALEPLAAWARGLGSTLTLEANPGTIPEPKKVARAPSPDAFGRSGRHIRSRR